MPLIRPLLTGAVWGLLLMASPAELDSQPPPPCALEKNPVTEMGQRFEEGRDLVTGARELDTFAETRYIRARLSARGGSGDWRLVVRDMSGHPLEAFAPADFKERPVLWTKRIPGSFALFDLVQDAAGNAPDLVLTEYLAVEAEAKRPYYSSQNEANPQLKPLYAEGVSLDDRRLGDHVGFVIVGFGTIAWTCTAILVADDIILTNWHCGGFHQLKDESYWGDQICPGMIIDFSWDDDAVSSDFGCSQVLLTDKARDFAWLSVHPLRGASSPTPARLGRAAPSGPLRIVHHPEARQKVVSRCPAVGGLHEGWTGEPGVSFSHQCDTEGGSSGAPVFDARGTVIGLHHHGFKIDPKTCKPADRFNKAMSVGKILERVEEWSRATGDDGVLRRAAVARDVLRRLRLSPP